MPFSSKACPKLTPSSGLLISPHSISHDTNSLGTQDKEAYDEAQVSGSVSKSTSKPREEMLKIHMVKCTTQFYGITHSYLTLFTQPGYRRNDKYTQIYFSTAFGFKTVSFQRHENWLLSIMAQVTVVQYLLLITRWALCNPTSWHVAWLVRSLTFLLLSNI